MGKGIKLCYLYAEDENRQPLIDVCLDNELDFKWDGNNLNIRKKDNYIEGFYGKNIINLNLIIGKNGSGKTSLINKILEYSESITNKFIKVCKIGLKYEIEFDKIYEIKDINCRCNDDSINIHDFKLEPITFKNELNGLYLSSRKREIDEKYANIFFTNQFSQSSRNESIYISRIVQGINIGIRNLLKNPDKMFEGSRDADSVVNVYDSFYYSNIISYLNNYFYRKKRNIEDITEMENINFEVPEIFALIDTNVSDLSILFQKTYLRIFQGKKLGQLEKIQYKILGVRKPINQIDCCIIAFIDSLLLILKNSEESSEGTNTEKLLEKLISWLIEIQFGNDIEYYNKQITILKDDYLKCNHNRTKEKLKEKIDNFIEMIRTLEKIENIMYDDNTKNIKALISIKYCSEEIKKFLDLSSKCIINQQSYFNYGFYTNELKKIRYSSGQEQILAMFSFIYYGYNKLLTNNNKQNIDTIFLVMDEPDTYMHPEWKRVFFSCLFKFIEQIFQGINIQLIVTTNSPILAGDIPRKDIIMLEDMEVTKDGKTKIKIKDSKKETFGRNLLSLFKDVFFMDSTMGEFSVNKINDILEKIEEFKNIIDKEEKIEKEKSIQSQIDIIAEPLIKRKVQGMFDKVNGKESKDIENVIKDAKDKGVSIEDISTLTGKSKSEIERILKSE